MINRKAFKGKYYEDIKQGIINRYSNIYPNNTIQIEYSATEKEYFFRVFVDGKKIDNSGKVVDSFIFITKYSNETAIKLFASMSKDEFESKFNDYSEDNYTVLKEKIDQLVSEYSTKEGFIFTRVEVDKNGYVLNWYHPEKSGTHKKFLSKDIEFYKNSIYHRFAITPITTATMNNAIRNIKRKLEYTLRDYNLRYKLDNIAKSYNTESEDK